MRTARSFDTDQFATHLARMAAIARGMPPAFKGAGVHEPVMSPDGDHIGDMLDGAGLYLNSDLKSYGLTKPIPYVFERSPVQRLLDKTRNTCGAITTMDGVINARAGGKADDVIASKASITTVANVWSTLFKAGGMPAAGTYTAIPTGAVMDRSNAGALSLGLANPTGSDKKYLLTFGAIATQQINMFQLVDMLVAAGNVSGTSTSAQTTSTAALTRYTTGAGVYITCEVTTQLGGTASNLTGSYTNQAGTAAQAIPSVAMTTSAIVGRLQPNTTSPAIVLASGDYGVQAVASLTLSASMLAGAFALKLYKPLLWMPGLVANVYSERDSTTQIDGLVELANASLVIGCLEVFVLPNTTSTGQCTMAIRTCAG